MKLGSFIDKKAILVGDNFNSVLEAVDALINIFEKRGLLPVSGEEVKKIIREREETGSTLLPTGVAIPHGRIEGFQDLLISVWLPAALGGVPSALETTASICTKASIGIAETPITVLAGSALLKNVV